MFSGGLDSTAMLVQLLVTLLQLRLEEAQAAGQLHDGGLLIADKGDQLSGRVLSSVQ